eukprot:4012507-Prorocentrum_lima.AAC.1
MDQRGGALVANLKEPDARFLAPPDVVVQGLRVAPKAAEGVYLSVAVDGLEVVEAVLLSVATRVVEDAHRGSMQNGDA